MLFNSVEFAIFLPLVFALYWGVFGKHLRAQNTFLALSSFVFYGWWDWRFLLLMIFSASIDFISGLLIVRTTDTTKRKFFLSLSIVTNLGILFFFKYFNFFVESFSQAFRFFGTQLETSSLQIVLPVGISFYTFQALSYTVDVYRNNLKPTTDPVAYFSFISFFPQLVAGPIERATHLLPQFYAPRRFNYGLASDGMRQILWGLFKKIVVADNSASYVNRIFDHYTDYSGSTLLIGAFLFSIQIYCDFSGYSDVAIGTGRLFGIQLTRNFAFPYFSRDIAEFWRRWHISLTTWFKDYVYIPLGGNKGKLSKQLKNIVIIFLLSGLWHGANWTFVFWGLLNAIYFFPLVLLKSNRNNLDMVASNSFFPSVKELMSMIFTFSLVLVAWIFFRSIDLAHAFGYIHRMITVGFFTWPELFPKTELMFIFVLLCVEWLQRHKQHGLDFSGVEIPVGVRWSFYLIVLVIIGWFAGDQQQFIYFQF